MTDLTSVQQKAARSYQDSHTQAVFFVMKEKSMESMVVLGGS